jgi:predicted ATPase/DNA-binding winged helix-turn-helix (wHTH) protein
MSVLANKVGAPDAESCGLGKNFGKTVGVPSRSVHFPPFRLEAGRQALYRGPETVPLRPKTMAVLRCLLERAGQLVTKTDLLDAVWPETAVSDAVLKVSIRELREALQDDPKAPRYIETAHGSGYRFIAALAGDNLPVPLTSFIGREREIDEAKELLGRARLLTLTGPGGSGKTRLAVRVAREVQGDYQDGVWWVALSALNDPELVPQTVAAVLGVREIPGRTPLQTLTAQLSPKRLLLVLDNCEHMIVSCALLAETLLRACPFLRILATSREALAVAGETTVLVSPLSLPAPERPVSLEELRRSEAVRLFVERARSAQPRFEPRAANAAALAQVCRQLDGLPLAIELAAPRVKALTVEELAARLGDCFQLLTAGGRTELPRHQTLRAAIDWSYDLLSGQERMLLERLSVFAGGWHLESAEAVCGGEGLPGSEVLGLLTRLVDKSLVVAGEESGQTRYTLLETVRQYAHEKLSRSGSEAALRARHAQHYLALTEESAPRIKSAQRASFLARLGQEHDNLRAAFRSLSQAGDTDGQLRLCHALLLFWFQAGLWSEGRARCREALQASAGEGRTPARGRVMAGEGMFACFMGDHTVALERLEESASIHRELGDRVDLAHALRFLVFDVAESDPARARAVAEEALAIYEEHTGPGFDLAITIAQAGTAALLQKDYPAARAYYLRSAHLFRALGDAWGLSVPLGKLGLVLVRMGHWDEAARYLRESLSVQRDVGERWYLSLSVEGLAQWLTAQGRHERAARLFGAGEALREAVGAAVLVLYRNGYEQAMADLKSGLGEERLAALWAEGRAMALEQAVAYALADPDDAGDDA